MRNILNLALAAILFIAPMPAFAQTGTLAYQVIVADCSTIVYAPVGKLIPTYVDTTGKECGTTAAAGLPAGAATSAKQDTGNASLSSIDTKATTGNTNTGATATSAASIDTKLTTSNTNTGATATSAASIDTKMSTSNTNTGNTATSTASTATNTATTATNTGTIATQTSHLPAALGQGTQAQSLPVVWPSDPDSRPASGNITVVDSGSTTTAGFNSISIVTGTPTAASVKSFAINGMSTVACTVTGTWTGTLTFEGSADGATYSANTLRQRGGSYRTATTTGNGIFQGDVSGMTNFRARATGAMTGTAVVQCAFTASSGPVQIQNPVSIFDNSSNAQATIKPASTAPAATDTSFVVGINPNSLVVTPTDRGGTIATGGTAQNAMSSNSSRRGGWCQNPASATEDLYISTTTSATTTGASDDADLAPGGTFSFTQDGLVIQTAISLNAVTTGHRYICKETQ